MLTSYLFPFGDWRKPLSQTRQNLQRFRFGDRGQTTLYSEAAPYAWLTGADPMGVCVGRGVREGGEREKQLCGDHPYHFQA